VCRSRMIGPFEGALRSYAGKSIIPMVFGVFGETNRMFDKILQALKRKQHPSQVLQISIFHLW